MPREKTQEVVETSVDNLLDKTSTLKKAGLPTAAIVLMVAMGFPGFWEFFANHSGEEAKVNAEVAYQLLKAQSEAHAKQLADFRAEMNDLRTVINQMLLARAQVGYGAQKMPEIVSPPSIAPLPANLEAAESTPIGQAAMVSAGIDPDGI